MFQTLLVKQIFKNHPVPQVLLVSINWALTSLIPVSGVRHLNSLDVCSCFPFHALAG